MVKQLSYALAVQTLAEQKAISSPEPFITTKHRETTNQASEHLVSEFERASLIDEVRRLTDGHGYLYGVGQGIVAAFCYSVVLVLVALILKFFGIDVITMLIQANSGK